MRILDEKNNELSPELVDLQFGYLSQEIIIRDDAEPIDNITKHAWTDEDYEEIRRYHRLDAVEIALKRVDELKHNLSETDYIVIKIAEGAATKEEYSEVIDLRSEWRAEINELEEKVLKVERDNGTHKFVTNFN